MSATLSAIHIFPLKSGAPLPLASAQVGTRGFEHDRRWMVIDADDEFLTGRDEPRLTLIRALPADGFSNDGLTNDGLANGTLTLNAPGMPELRVVPPPSDATRIATAVWGAAVTPRSAGAEADAWISTFLGRRCRLVHMDADCHRAVKAKYDGRYGMDGDEVSFADAFPLLLISQAALDQLNAKLARPVPILRFRPNLVVAGTTPHAEDGWKRVRIGAVEFDVVKACVRCVFTTVDFERGERDPSGEPLRTLIGYRRGDEGVTFGQNLIPRGHGVVRVGDAVSVIA
jgi:uncharacterized protein YcbX